MANTKCFSLVRGRAMRVTKLDGCGAPVPGPRSTVVSDGFISIGLTANTEEGEAISITNAAGKVCILDEPCPTFTGYDVEVQFCGVNPDLIAAMSGQPLVYDAGTDPTAIGFRMNSAVDGCDLGFALEVWSSVPAAVCGASGGQSYGYFLIPFLKGGVLGDFTIENAAINFTLSGAKTKDGSAWGTGAYDVIDTGTSGTLVPGKLLAPIDENDHLHVQLTEVPPPEAEDCGAESLGSPATGVTAGSPGAWTPPGSYGPETVAEANAGSVDGTTEFTEGQYVVLSDGSHAHWDGTTWVAGDAPA